MIAPDKSSFDFASLADFAVQFLAVAYGVYATASDFKEEREGGGKRLSRSGKIGIAFLVAVSIASIGVKIYQHQKEAKSKAEAEATQQKMIADLEQSLGNSKVMSKALESADAKLTGEAHTLQEQSTKMSGLLQGTQASLAATSRVLDPLDDAFKVEIWEKISSSDPAIADYIRNEHIPFGSYKRSFSGDDYWPKKEDGNFHEYLQMHQFQIEIAKTSSYNARTSYRGGGMPSRESISTWAVCSTDKEFPSSHESFWIENDGVNVECDVENLKWENNGDIRSYLDLKHSILTLIYTRLGIELEDYHEPIPPSLQLVVEIYTKNHRALIQKFRVVPCREPLGESICYAAPMPDGF
jgi:hypothetical protein